MSSINTPRGKFYYKPINIYLGIKQIDRDIAFQNLKILLEILKKHDIQVSPALGTLLGIIRDNDFIEWDEDIDLFVLEEDKNKFLNALWDMKDHGFYLVRVERAGLLYSVMREGEYVDFYIMQKLSPELRGSADIFMLDRHLNDLIDWNFKELIISVPKDYDEFLELRYGNWRKPVKYANFEMSWLQIFKAKCINIIKSIIPRPIKYKMLKKYHRKSYEKFLMRCESIGIKFKYPINY